jgi:hypothetical protein
MVILPFADEQAARDMIRRWEAAGLASKGTVVDVWGVRDAGTDAATWECREANALGLGDGSDGDLADLWPEA